MLPSLRQRLVIAAATVVAAWVWVWASDAMSSLDGGSGFSLTNARVGSIQAALVVAALGIPVLIVGLLTAVQGNMLSGIFVVAAALCVLAGLGGPIDGWLWWAADNDALPGHYGRLIIELLAWQAGLAVVFAIIQTLRQPMRQRMPALAFNDHLGANVRIQFPQANSLAAGLVCSLTAGTLCWFLIRSTAIEQVIASMLLAFGIGGLIGHVMFPRANPLGILILGPTMVAMATYAWMMVRYDTSYQVMVAWYGQKLPGPALALPIYYASAAVAGSSMGIGFGQSLDAARLQVEDKE